MRALGIDLGSKRIGVAVSDRSGTLASPLAVLQRTTSHAEDHRRIAALVMEEEAVRVIVGLPLSLDGSIGRAAQAAINEAAEMASVLDVPVETFDERLTTVSAHALLEPRMRSKERRGIVDKVAAAVMLQTWLDAGRMRAQR